MNTEANRPGEDAQGRPSLLIADDDAVVRSTLGSHLEGDFEVIAVAEDATEAIELAAQHQPDAALIDVEMPGGGALEAVPQITTRSPDTCIVILSADESRETVLELLAAGAMAYVRKGISAVEVGTTLATAIKAKGNQPQT